jgi:small subunit ribosomal protein S3
MRPGLIIGRGGETIKELARALEEKFQLPNPQISVAEIEVPEFNAHVVASRVASALQRGVHFRRAGFWALNQVMSAGALGAEIIVSGKLRTERARFEKFRAGYLPKSGEPPLEYLQTAEMHVQLKPGIFGVKVRIMPPNVQFPDRVEVLENVSKMEETKPAVETEGVVKVTEDTEIHEATPETSEKVSPKQILENESIKAEEKLTRADEPEKTGKSDARSKTRPQREKAEKKTRSPKVEKGNN